MSRIRTIILLLYSLGVSIIVKSRPIVGPQQRISENPKDVSAPLGSTVILRCTVENQKGTLIWTKNGFVLGAGRDLPSWPRYSIVGGLAKAGEYHLKIANVTLWDDAEYQCQVVKTKAQPPSKSAFAKLNVLVSPETPVMENSKSLLKAREDKPVEVSCKTSKSKPAVAIHWILSEEFGGSGKVMQKFNESNVITETTLTDEGAFQTQSTLTYIPDRAHEQIFLSCLISHETLDKPVIKSSPIHVEYPPVVKVEIHGTRDGLREHGAVTFKCTVDAEPSDELKYVWKLNGRAVLGETRPVFRIPVLRKADHHGANVECNVWNSVGVGAGIFQMHLSYGPRAVSTSVDPLIKVVDVGNTVDLRCLVDSNPPAKISWYKEGRPKVDTPTEVETYIGMTEQNLICRIRGFPVPSAVIWHKNGRLINVKTSEQYSAHQIEMTEEILSILTVQNVGVDDLAVYNCTALNSYGSDTGQINLLYVTGHSSITYLYIFIPCAFILIVSIFVVTLLIRSWCLLIHRHRRHEAGGADDRNGPRHHYYSRPQRSTSMSNTTSCSAGRSPPSTFSPSTPSPVRLIDATAAAAKTTKLNEGDDNGDLNNNTDFLESNEILMAPAYADVHHHFQQDRLLPPPDSPLQLSVIDSRFNFNDASLMTTTTTTTTSNDLGTMMIMHNGDNDGLFGNELEFEDEVYLEAEGRK